MARTSAEAETEGGEGYFASVSDLMIGIVFVFLLMLTVLALNFREADERNQRLQLALEAAVARLRQDVQDREAARRELLERLASGLAARGVAFRIDQQSGVLRLSEDVPFAVGRADLTERTRRTVQILAEVLGQILPCFAMGGERIACGAGDAPILEAVLIEGHTDQQGFTNMTSSQSILENDRLSAARALSVFAELRRLQPSLDLLRNGEEVPLLGISGYGQRRPVAPGSDEAAFALNRRIDIRFVLSARTSEEVRRLIEQIDTLRRVPP